MPENTSTQHADSDIVVELRAVDKHFGPLHALRNINLRVNRGEVVVVLGPSGSGKSTMCRTINRLETIDSGEILVDGAPQPAEGKELFKFRTEVGMVFQSFNLFANRTILDNVTLAPRKILGQSKTDAERRARELLDMVGIGSKAGSYPAQLSGGQSQRAAIARALAMEPKVILFDEPTSALDPESTQDVLTTMRQLAERGTTMVVVTHEMSFARSCADRIIFMADGAIIESADPETFFSAPSSERARSFLSSVH
ncbi:amino acid ABC transporter ATP-binding protein [Pseudarthrobacter niigatensis]|uniref:ABC-type polar-amino-acid transporter n=1 Tax=Pseudarthrobacter niigatensis TaxID=369935 RepID=A0AAJ1SS21_9MICC|nr:amino acid ABC transporter ATP-binding protein [Pseudarthrobacter niigatensis]MDQ0144668.1 glutamate transport system ATP-binding protein [Pseudarthrobacter niigatensis]MDQ0265314.1 glutamate transport system ATP-binding protein [Pseudarthrobacter niigatensis]